jgi:hypothetical protein
VAATAKFDYKFSDRTSLTVIGSNIILDAFNNNDPTRRQYLPPRRQLPLRRQPTQCEWHLREQRLPDITTVTNNAQFWRYSVYHVPSFFDIITFNHDFGKGWKLDSKSTPTATPTTSTIRTRPTRIWLPTRC